jgi:hypothetical protein
MTSAVQPQATGLDPESDMLSFGPSPRRRLSRRARWLVGLLVVLALAFGIWRVLPKPPPDFTLADLQGAYTPMVRSDGTNSVSTLTSGTLTEPPVSVSPAACSPLFDATLSNQFPATALDGVSTFWLDDGSASISLMTFRFVDSAAAQVQFDSIASALGTCGGGGVRVDEQSDVTVDAQPVPALATVEKYLSYQVGSPSASSRFTTDVAQLDNTVTWQYRYEYRRSAESSSSAAQQLMASLVTQLRDVQDAHR